MIEKITIIFVTSVLIGIFAALWGISTQAEPDSSQKDIYFVTLYYGIEGFVVVWIIALIGLLYDKKSAKRLNKSSSVASSKISSDT